MELDREDVRVDLVGFHGRYEEFWPVLIGCLNLNQWKKEIKGQLDNSDVNSHSNSICVYT